jgi:hypothetical protein
MPQQFWLKDPYISNEAYEFLPRETGPKDGKKFVSSRSTATVRVSRQGDNILPNVAT